MAMTLQVSINAQYETTAAALGSALKSLCSKFQSDLYLNASIRMWIHVLHVTDVCISGMAADAVRSMQEAWPSTQHLTHIPAAASRFWRGTSFLAHCRQWALIFPLVSATQWEMPHYAPWW